MILLLPLLFVGITACQNKSNTTIDAQRSSLAPGHSLGISSVPNLRDMGGYKNKDGETFVSSLLYRANQLAPISPGDMEKLAQLNLNNVYDLRTIEERESLPDQLPVGVNDVWLDVLADDSSAGAAQIPELLQNPKETNVSLGGGKVEAMLQKTYREFISLPSANAAFSKLFISLSDQSKLPALFHCTTGKDRTGWTAAALLTLLGMSEETVMEYYLRSNDYILPFYKERIDAFAVAGGERAIAEAILGVKPEYLEAAFHEMGKRYGTIENYFSEGLGVDAAGQQALRDLYLALGK
jgi:protein-tyrosine phosphatase